MIMKDKQPILSICIPTYNRTTDLACNLSLLEKFLKQDNLCDVVRIVIANNHSSDSTTQCVREFINKNDLHIEYYENDKNIGAGPNLVYVVEKASTTWVMLLGDDDYLEPWYIAECLQQIDKYPNLGCIIPNYINYYPATQTYGELREENCETQYYKGGFDACLQNAWRAHQLSGLCFRRDNLPEEYRNRGLNNLYPQIFFVSYSSLNHDVLHFGQRCLAVSGIPQDKKDWNYGNDGLVNDIFENFKHLRVSYHQRALLESQFIKRDPRYYWTTDNVNKCVESILLGKNVSYLGRYYIAKNILHNCCYSGKKLRIPLYILARLILLKQLFTSKPIGI